MTNHCGYPLHLLSQWIKLNMQYGKSYFPNFYDLKSVGKFNGFRNIEIKLNNDSSISWAFGGWAQTAFDKRVVSFLTMNKISNPAALQVQANAIYISVFFLRWNNVN